MGNILDKLGILVYKHKQKVLIFWLILLIFSLVSIFSGDKRNSENDLSGLEYTEAYQVNEILKSDFNFKVGTSFAVVIDQKINTDDLEQTIKKVFNVNKISEIKSHKIHQKKLLYIDFDKTKNFVDIYILAPKIREVLNNWSKKTNVKTFLTGNPAFQFDAYKAGQKDSARSEIIALIISLFILIYTFGALTSAFLPIIIGITTIVYANGLLRVLGLQINTLSQILSSLIGLGLAIDYSLFIISRYREEKQINNILESTKKVFRYPLKTIIVSSLIMLCSISALLIPDVSTSKVVVIHLFLVIFISLFNSAIILPALLIYTDRFLNKPAFIAKLINKTDSYKFWKNFSSHVTDYPKSYFILSCTLLLLLSIPVTKINIIEAVYTLTPENTESMKAYRILEKDGWGGELIPINLIVKSKDDIYSKEFVSFVFDLTKFLEKNENVESVQSITSWGNDNNTKEDYINLLGSIYTLGVFSQNQNLMPLINLNTGNNLTLLNVYSKDMIDINKTHRLIADIKTYASQNQNYQIMTGGVIARAQDFTQELYGHIPKMLALIFIGIYLILFFYMKSVVLPLKAGLMNFLPILSAFGILTMVFQYEFLNSFLSVNHINGVINMVPIILFCIVFGLSMDYEVLILSRITESYEQTKNVKSAIIEGMARSGSVITGAALILLAVFLPGIFSSSPPTKQICIGISSAIIIDATIVRLLLVPSFMMLMGKWNWYRFRKL